MLTSAYFQWQYLIFELPFLLAVVFVALSAFGVLEADHDMDVDHDMDMDHDMDTDHDVGVEHDSELGGGHDASFVARILGVLGVGRVPISIVIISFLVIWGFTGFWSNRLLAHILFLPMFYGWVSMGLAGFASVIATRFVAGTIAKIMPKTETYATKAADLVGRRGTVIHAVDERSGTIRVTDQFHQLLDLQCRTSLNGEKLPVGSNGVITKFDPVQRQYIVAVAQVIPAVN